MPYAWMVLSLLLLSCSDAEEYLKKINNLTSDETEFTLPPGSTAAGFLAKSTGTLSTDVTGVLDALNVAIKQTGKANLVAQGFALADGDETADVTTKGADTLEKVRSAKKELNPDAYSQDKANNFTKDNGVSLAAAKDYTKDTIKWDAAVAADYTIPVLSKMPVRSQGQRGTCAAFAGIGQIEGYILQNSSLASIDLSEQRFYAMSKPDHWATGGDVNEGGSNSGDGFGKSYFKAVKYGDQTSPTTYNISDTFNIPIEAKCPYVDEGSGNDIQSPATKSGNCTSGVVQVKDFTSWQYQWEQRPDSAQDVYNFLRDKKYPVIVFTKLSDNWEENDGIVTWAGAQGTGSTSHASGHAYLVVGMKKLTEAEYPGEGGMCFYIKNSWGKGWGVNGMSCMTLTWFNNHRYTSAFPAVLSVAVDTAALNTQVNEQDKKPNELKEPDKETKTIDDTKSSRPRGRVSFFHNQNLALTAEDYTFAKLLDNNDGFSKILYRSEGDDPKFKDFYLRGLLADGTTQTNDVKLAIDGDNKIFADLEGKGYTNVGVLDVASKTVKLCSQEYSEKCYLNYLKDSNELLVAITQAELTRDDTEGPYDWTLLGTSGTGFEISLPDGFSTKIDIRLSKAGIKTNPLRFRIKPIDGDIVYQGQSVGDYQKGELCSGGYKSVCRVVKTDEKFLIMFKSAKG